MAACAQEPLSAPGDVSQALPLFQAKRYAEALPLLQKWVLLEPLNSKAHFYLASCSYYTGDLRNATLHYYLASKYSMTADGKWDSKLKLYADQLLAGLSPPDQKWVLERLDLGYWGKYDPLGTARPTPVPDSREFGVRFTTQFLLFNLADFNQMLQYREYITQNFYTAENPSNTLQASVPSNDFNLEIEPFYRLGNDWEVGPFFSYFLLNAPNYENFDNNPNYFNDFNYGLSALSAGLKARYYFWDLEKGRVRFFLEPGAGFLPVYINFTQSYQDAIPYSISPNAPTNQLGYMVSSLGYEGELDLGMKFETAGGLVASLSVGYQVAVASGFHGTWWDNALPATNGITGSVRMYHDAASNQSYLSFEPDNPAYWPTLGENQNFINNSSNVVVDLSGFRASFDMMLYF